MEQSSFMECRNKCKIADDCSWYSYSSSNDNTCLLHSECTQRDNDVKWISSQKQCYINECYMPIKCSKGSVSE